jgi:hypothetical protein
MEKEILIEFVKWLRSEYQIEEVYEMFADEFLQDRARKNLVQPDVIKSVCQCEKADLCMEDDNCGKCGLEVKG